MNLPGDRLLPIANSRDSSGHMSLPFLKPHRDGTILLVRAQPGARRNEIRGEQDGMLKVSVTQSPEKGKANKALITLLSKAFSLRKSQLELIVGQTSQQKQFLVRDVGPQELAQRIEQILEP